MRDSGCKQPPSVLEHQTPAPTELRIERLRRRSKLGPARLAGIVGVPRSTVHRVLTRRGPEMRVWDGDEVHTFLATWRLLVTCGKGIT
jgi:hypothetical protein